MSGVKAQILVIDDDEIVRNSCTNVLTQEGYIVKTAENGESGLRLFKEFHPDLVLIDLKMPGKTGMEVLEEIENADPDVLKIVITGYASVSSAVDAMKRGAYDFIPKPFTPDEICLIVARGLEKRRFVLERKALRLSQEKIRRNMISLVSHELRAPLAATIQYLEIILSGMAGDISPVAKDMADRSNVRIREMLELISKWLNLATFDPAKMTENFEDVNLVKVALESVNLLKPLAEEKKVKLSVDAPERLSPIKGSKVALGEIFNNLIGNAIKYNNEGGRVKVRLSGDDREILVEVSDNGIGMDEEHLPRIFDEFYRVDGRRNAPVQGTGLGLAIVKTMVDAHGGRIDVKSVLDEGTTFRVRLPKNFEPKGGR